MFDEGENPKIAVKNSRAVLRSTESQPTCNCKGRRPVNVCRPPNPLPNPLPPPKSTAQGIPIWESVFFFVLAQRPCPQPQRFLFFLG